MLIVIMGYMLFLFGMQPIENTLVASFTPDKVRHSAYGAKFVLTFGVGAIAVHLVGWIKQTWSLSAVFVAMGLVSVAIVLCISLLIVSTVYFHGEIVFPGSCPLAPNSIGEHL